MAKEKIYIFNLITALCFLIAGIITIINENYLQSIAYICLVILFTLLGMDNYKKYKKNIK